MDMDMQKFLNLLLENVNQSIRKNVLMMIWGCHYALSITYIFPALRNLSLRTDNPAWKEP